MKKIHFKQFLEDIGYLDALRDFLGVDADDTIGQQTNWGVGFPSGGLMYNGAFYKVDKVYRHGGKVQGAILSPIEVKGSYTQKLFHRGSKMAAKYKPPAGKVYVDAETFDKLMTQGLGGGGGASGGLGGGLPGGGII